MAKPVKSIWTVTFDLGGANEYVLVEPDLLLDDEVETNWQDVVEDADYIEADDSEPLGFGNRKREFKVTVYRNHASPAAAREHGFVTDLAVPDSSVSGTLTVAITGGATYVYSNCCFVSGRTVQTRVGLHQTATTYTLKCGALNAGSTPPPEGPSAEGALLYVQGGTGLLDAGGATPDHREAVATWTNQGTEDDLEQPTAGERPYAIDADGLWLPGTAGNYGRVTHNANFSYGTDFMFRIDVVLPTYRPAGAVCLMSQAPVAGSYVWMLMLEPTGLLTLYLTTSGAAWTHNYQSTVPLPTGDNEYVGIQVVKNGAVLSFFLHGEMDSPLAGMLLGAQVAITNIDPPNIGSNLEIGSHGVGANNPLLGLVQLAAVWQYSTGSPSADSYVNATWARKFKGGVQTGYGDTASGVTVLRNGTDPAALSAAPSLRFDGADNSMVPATPLKMNAVNGITIMWKGVLNRVTDTQDLVFIATAGTNPRALLRLNGSGVEVHARRLDAEAIATISHATGLTVTTATTTLAAVINFVTGSVALYSGVGGLTLLTVGTLTSSGGACEATDSSETRIMAGQGEANPAAADVSGIFIDDRVLTLAELQALAAAL